MHRIRDIGVRILKDLGVDINNYCVRESYRNILEEIYKVRDKMRMELKNNIPDSFRQRC